MAAALSALVDAPAGVRQLLGILAFRLLPFTGAVVLSRDRSWFVRVCVVAAYGVLSAAAAQYGATPLYWLLLAYAYFAAAGWTAYELLPHVASKMLWLGVVVLLFWLLPSAAIHPTPMVVLTLGWDFVLAAYSYGVDTFGKRDRSLGDFLFFLLVNPSLVYSRRGIRLHDPRFDLHGIGRAWLGVFALFVSTGMLESMHAHAVATDVGGGTARRASLLLLVGAFRFGSEYAAQSGLASVQIGVMRQLGYRLPERFRNPLLARSPADFWRRWNTYVGSWARLYVFLPLVGALRRSALQKRSVSAAAILLTFLVVGVLHDAFVIAAARELKAPATMWFIGVGAVVVLWELPGTLRRRRRSASWGGAFERLAFLTVVMSAAAHLWW